MYIFIIVILLFLTTYFIYGYYVGFNCKFILTNNVATFFNPEFPKNPDLTVRVNEKLLTQLNMPSDRLHEEVVINKRLKIGYNFVYAESDSAGIFGSNRFLIFQPREIIIALQGSETDKHLMLVVY